MIAVVAAALLAVGAWALAAAATAALPTTGLVALVPPLTRASYRARLAGRRAALAVVRAGGIVIVAGALAAIVVLRDDADRLMTAGLVLLAAEGVTLVAAWARARHVARRALAQDDGTDVPDDEDEPLPHPEPAPEISDDPRDNPPLALTPHELADALRTRFADLHPDQELRMRSVEPDGDAVRVLLDGRVGDRGGLYGAILTIPRSTKDPRWAEWRGFGRDEWIEHACFWLVVEAYDTRRYAGTRDGITWLDLD